MLRGSHDKAAGQNPLHLVSAWSSDARLGCQKQIAAKIIAGGGKYILALKANHSKLHAAVATAFTQAARRDLKVAGLRCHATEETSRGRTERRQYMIMPAPRRLPGDPH